MSEFKSLRSLTEDLVYFSLLEENNELHQDQNQNQYDESELDSFLTSFFEKNSIEEKIDLLNEGDYLLTSRPHIPLSEGHNMFPNELFQLMQTRIGFYQVLRVFYNFVARNSNIYIDNLLHDGLVDFLAQILVENEEKRDLSLEETCCILQILKSIAERENNTLTFDFKDGKCALSGYTITSGASSSYWEYATSFTWEGSNDGHHWDIIDEQSTTYDSSEDTTKNRTFTCKNPLTRKKTRSFS